MARGMQILSALLADERVITTMCDSPSLHASRAVTRLTVYRAPQVNLTASTMGMVYVMVMLVKRIMKLL